VFSQEKLRHNADNTPNLELGLQCNGSRSRAGAVEIQVRYVASSRNEGGTKATALESRY